MRTALFDLDGTLVDTSYVHAVCWWEALVQQDRQVPMAQIHRAVGLGADLILDHLLGEDHDTAHDEEIVAAHATLFGTWYPRVRAFPQAADLLRAVSRSGQSVVFATSGSQQDLDAFCSVLDVDDVVAAATTSADAERSKPATDILRVALDRVGGSPDDAVMVGDAVWDMMAAQRLGVTGIGLQCGGVSAGELRDAGAAEVWRDPEDLLSHLEDSVLGTVS